MTYLIRDLIRCLVGLAVIILVAGQMIGGKSPASHPAPLVTPLYAQDDEPDHRLYLPTLHVGTISQPSPSDGRASWGSPIALTADGSALWVANPDSGSVTRLAVDAVTDALVKTVELPVGIEPWSLALAPQEDTLYVLDRAAGTLIVVDPATQQINNTILLGPEPIQLALSPTGALAYVTLMTSDTLLVLETRSGKIMERVQVAALPYGVAVSDDGDEQDDDERILVTHLLAEPATTPDGDRLANVTVLDAATLKTETVLLRPNERGFANRQTAIAVHQNRAWVTQVRAAPELPNSLTTTLFAGISTLTLTDNSTGATAARWGEDVAAFLPLNDQDIFGSPVNNPEAVLPGPNGKRLYVVLAGSDLVEVIDIADPTRPKLVKFLPTGPSPRGMVIRQDGRRGYVMNYLGRSVTVLDLEELGVIDTVTTTSEPLDPDLLRGKRLFHHAVDPRLSQGSWFSCATCHLDGGTDGVTWVTFDGPRQTPPLWNASVTGPWHWSATLDELHDVEATIQQLQHGLGLAPGADPRLMGVPNAGRSADLDALARFVAEGIRPPMLPQEDIPDDADALANGRTLFIQQGCHTCHGGPAWTSSRLTGAPGTLDPDGNDRVDDALLDVGTLTPQDVLGATGFDPPSLLNVDLTAPYLHDGSMPTLLDLLASGHPTPDAGNTLSTGELADLVQFLRTIGIETTPVAEFEHTQ